MSKSSDAEFPSSSYQYLSPCSPSNPLAGQKRVGVSTEELNTTVKGDTKRPRYFVGYSLHSTRPHQTLSFLGDPAEGQEQERSTTSPLPPFIDRWLDTFLSWSSEHKNKALDAIISVCDSVLLKHMLERIRPQFQRDFISLLPKELALHVLSFLNPRDLLVAAQICRTWHTLCDDNLLWRDKCKRYEIDESILKSSCRRPAGAVISNQWKQMYLTKHKIDYNWRFTELVHPDRLKTLKGHDDHVVTCLQFTRNRIVSGSDDNTLRVWNATTGKHLRTLVGHTGGVWCSEFDGITVVSGSTDRTLRVRHHLRAHCGPNSMRNSV
jgi:F-box/WD-40 domain protein 7